MCRPRGQPNYITTFVFLCQALFSSFFKLFRALPGKTSVVAPPSQTAYRGYYCWSLLSSTFFRFFNLNFTCLIRTAPSKLPQTLLPQDFQSPDGKCSLIIAKSPLLVNTFFHGFLNFFQGPHICPSTFFLLTRYARPLSD